MHKGISHNLYPAHIITHNRNNKGPKIDPYDTPQLMFAKLENLLFHIDLKIPISEVDSNQATD